MLDQLIATISVLRAAGEPFAIAIVVRFEAPISGKTGDKAIIRADGSMTGWIGGGCSQPIVIKEALKSLQDRQPRLIRISPVADPNSEAGIVDYTMTCHSGGTLDIYIEPILPNPQIVIIGRSTAAQTLARLAKAIDFGISVAAPGATKEMFPSADAIVEKFDLSAFRVTPDTFIVVSTQGESDEEGLEAALRTEAGYVAFIASRTKAQKISEDLLDRGVSAGRIAVVRAPAGLQIGAVSPEEIAVSVLAEIVQVRRSRAAAAESKTSAPATTAKDPVCGMTVEIATAKFKSERKNGAVYFCSGGCKQRFDFDPKKYAKAVKAQR